MVRTSSITLAVLRTLSRPEPPPDLHSRIMEAIHAETARHQRHRRIRRAAVGALAAMMHVVVLQIGER